MPHIPNAPRRGHPARPRRDETPATPEEVGHAKRTPHSYGQSAPMPEAKPHDASTDTPEAAEVVVDGVRKEIPDE